MGYTNEQKQVAVAIVERSGGMTAEALQLIRESLQAPGLSKSTVHSWLQQSGVRPTSAKAEPPNRTEPAISEPPPKKETPAPRLVVTEQVDDALDDIFERVARTYLAHAQKKAVVDDTKGKDAIMAAAIAVDKMRLIRGLPTAVVQVLPVIMDKLNDLGISASDYFNAMLQELANAQRADAD